MNEKGLMVEHLGIGKVLDDYKLHVPKNQREYSWQRKHVAALFEDLEEAITDNRANYFLGTIVVVAQPDSETLEVVDGQQRLATTTILLSAFRDFFDEKKDQMMVQSIENDFLSVIDRRSKEQQPKLRLNVDDNDFFRKNIINRPGQRIMIPEAVTNSNKRIKEASDIAKQMVTKIVESHSEKNLQSIINDWIDYIKHRATVVLLTAPTKSDAFIMFETLNDRGLDASQADLVKNYLFSKAGDRLAEAQQQWSGMLATIESVDQKEPLMEYLRHFSCLYFGATRDHQIFNRIETLVKSQTQAIEFVISLKDCASDYSATFNPHHAKWVDYDPSVKNAISVFNILDVRNVRPLILAVAHCHDADNIQKSFRALTKWLVRFLVSGGGSGGVMDAQYSDWAKQIYSKEITKHGELSDAAKKFIPSDSAFESDFAVMRVKKAKLAKYYLRCLERAKRQEKFPELAGAQDESFDLEHVLPKNPPEIWNHIPADEAEDVVDRLGNLALMKCNANHSIGTSSFGDKKKAFAKEATNLLTVEIAGFDDWGKDSINKRQTDLAKLALKAWSV